MNWFVIYTKPQQELKVLEGLNKIGVEAYAPFKEEIRQWSDRKKKVLIPLIKSYVFVRVDFENRNRVFEISGVVRYLFWLGKPAVVFDREIKALKSSLEEPYSSLKIESLAVGEKLVINEGPFKDKEGTILKLNSKKVTIFLEQLGLLVTISY